MVTLDNDNADGLKITSIPSEPKTRKNDIVWFIKTGFFLFFFKQFAFFLSLVAFYEWKKNHKEDEKNNFEPISFWKIGFGLSIGFATWNVLVSIMLTLTLIFTVKPGQDIRSMRLWHLLQKINNSENISTKDLMQKPPVAEEKPIQTNSQTSKKTSIKSIVDRLKGLENLIYLNINKKTADDVDLLILNISHPQARTVLKEFLEKMGSKACVLKIVFSFEDKKIAENWIWNTQHEPEGSLTFAYKFINSHDNKSFSDNLSEAHMLNDSIKSEPQETVKNPIKNKIQQKMWPEISFYNQYSQYVAFFVSNDHVSIYNSDHIKESVWLDSPAKKTQKRKITHFSQDKESTTKSFNYAQ